MVRSIAKWSILPGIYWVQWRSQDLILGGEAVINNVRGSEATEPERARGGGGGGEGVGGVSPSHSESFLHFDVVNGAIWCICPVFSTYSTNLYLILYFGNGWKAAASHAYTQLYFPFFSLSPFFCVACFFFFLGGGGRPPPPPPWLRAWLGHFNTRGGVNMWHVWIASAPINFLITIYRY